MLSFTSSVDALFRQGGKHL